MTTHKHTHTWARKRFFGGGGEEEQYFVETQVKERDV